MDKKSTAPNVAKQIAILVSAGLLGNIAMSGAQGIKEKYDKTRNMKRHWDKLKTVFPEELAGENEKENLINFESIYSIAPSIAKVPGLSIHFLRMAKEYSTGGLDPSTIGTLAKAESDLASAREKGMLGAKLFGLDKKVVADMVDSSSIPTLPIGNMSLMGL